MALRQFIEALLDDGEVPAALYHEVSDLTADELAQFSAAWNPLPIERQRAVAAAMVQLAEENIELDFSAIFKLCLQADDDELLSSAIEGLWEEEDRSSIGPLVAVLQSDNSPGVRAAAALALGKFPALAEEGKLLPRDGQLVHHALMDLLRDELENLEVRRRCLEAVAPFNTIEFREYLRWAYESDDQDLRCSAIYAMGRSGEMAWLPTLLRELHSPDAAVRYETAHACGELGDAEAAPELLQLLDDADRQVQLAGVAALGKIGGPAARKALLEYAASDDASLADAARAELENLEFFQDPMRLYDEL